VSAGASRAAVASLDGTITRLDVADVRFPTSHTLDGSDAMNPDPDYSAAYVVVGTDRGDAVEGHGLSFTIGRGTEIVVTAIRSLAPLVIGQRLRDFVAAPGALRKHVTRASQRRWRRASFTWPPRRS
jgi:L-fuconate dehydratase